MTVYYQDPAVQLLNGDALEMLKEMPDAYVDAIVTDPPYALTQNKKGGSGVASINLTSPYGRARVTTGNGPGGFMGKAWDALLPGVDVWKEALRVSKPGAHLLTFGGTRTYHRLTCAIEDAGWEIRDCLMWLYGSGFPKSLDVSKAIDKEAGAEREVIGNNPAFRESYAKAKENGQVISNRGPGERYLTAAATEAAKQWTGWGTALKPAYEPILLARKPLEGTVAENVLKYGTGALNIDASRVQGAKGSGVWGSSNKTVNPKRTFVASPDAADYRTKEHDAGRWPANVLHDGSEEVVAAFPDAPGAFAAVGPQYGAKVSVNAYGDYGPRREFAPRLDTGSAARFFYTAKASADERQGQFGEDNTHPTVKPIALMMYLLQLVAPPNSLILDPFMGSGSTLVAAKELGLRSIGVDREEEYCQIAVKRLAQGVLPL